jgi:5'-nucleotidase
MRILLTNDDGIHAEGLWALHDQLSQKHTVQVVAPDRERSAVGHGITLHEPLRLTQVSLNGGPSGYAVNGTPADCIKLALLEVLNGKPDMVVSGINPGANLGVNVNYSGTVAAAKEASLYGVPAIAVSISDKVCPLYRDAAMFVEMLIDRVHRDGLPFGTILNVNLPNRPLQKMAGVRICRLGVDHMSEALDRRIDPREQVYFWQGCDAQRRYTDTTIDGGAVEQNYIAITPIKCDATDYGLLENLRDWQLKAAT